MLTIETVKIADLVEDFDIYPREKVYPSVLRELREAIKAGAEIPPIRIDKRSKRITDGWHRERTFKGLKYTELQAEVKEYASDAEMFLDAIALNSVHGRKLTPHDKTRCIGKADEFDIPLEAVSVALNIPFDKAEKIVVSNFAIYKAEPVALKHCTMHFSGRELTEKQFVYNRKAGGMPQSFFIGQVIAMLELDSVDWDDDRVVNALLRLRSLLETILTKNGAVVSK